MITFGQYFAWILGGAIGTILFHGTYVYFAQETRTQAKDRLTWQMAAFGGLVISGVYELLTQ